MTRAALECEQWWVMPPSLPTRGWHENREPLALFLSDDEWRMLAAAFEEMRINQRCSVWPVRRPVRARRTRVGRAGEAWGSRVRLEMTRDADAVDALLVLTRFTRARGRGRAAAVRGLVWRYRAAALPEFRTKLRGDSEGKFARPTDWRRLMVASPARSRLRRL